MQKQIKEKGSLHGVVERIERRGKAKLKKCHNKEQGSSKENYALSLLYCNPG